jgi:glycosyltransferase involved in cell wall biosynthesis
MQLMVSVVITTYNRPEKLKRAIQSVKDQTFKDWELIVVDDGSDVPPEGAVILPHSGIQAVAKNEGTRRAKGDYIAYLDDDNVWRPDHLQALFNEIEKHPEVDLVYGDRYIIDENNEIPPQIGIFSDFAPQLLLMRNYIDASDFIIRRKAIFDIGGWDERYKRCADWNLFARLVKNGSQFLHLPVIITDYYASKDSMSRKGTIEWNTYEVEVELPYLKEVKEPKVGMMTLTRDRLEYTKPCFESLKKAGYPFDHYVVDNGSKDGTVKWLETEYKPHHLIKNSKNQGISIGYNQALEAMGDKYDIIVQYDNDCLSLTDNWLKEMVELYKKNRMIVWAAYPEGLKDTPGGAPRQAYGQLGGHLVGMTQHLGGLCLIVPAKVFKTWRWSEFDPLRGIQDIVFCQWLTKHGYGLAYVEDIRVRHGLGGTAQQYKDFPEYFKQRKDEEGKRYEN